MTAAPLSAKETLRLAKLYDYGILDTLSERTYDDITALAAHICQTPTALVSLVDINRQWFKSRIGTEVQETPRSMAFCAHTIESRDVMLVEDTHQDPTFCDNPLVTGPPYIRFYAGAPLITPDGYALGSLCVLDYQPHYLTPAQIQALQVLSHQVIAQIELSYQRHQLELANQQLEQRVKERTASLSSSLYRLLTAQTKLLKREAASRHSALHDPLTDLPNRSYFLQRLSQSIQLAQRQPSHRYAVLFIDLDDFKPINDTLGHTVGDRLLVSIAERIKQMLRQSDLVARIGGDEFAVLLDDIPTQQHAVSAVKRLQNHLRTPVVIEGHKISTGASIGITFSSTGYLQPEDALRDADTAMYQAKKQAKQRIRQQLTLQLKTQDHPSPILIHDELPADNQQFAIFDADMQSTTQAQRTLESELRQAVLQEQFCLHYQPVFDLVTQKLSGFEMLLRWEHPQRGCLSADDFIATAEDIGIVQQMSAYIIEQSCLQLSKWRSFAKGASPSHSAWANVTLHINLSLMQIRHPPLIVQWQAALKKYEVPAAAIQLEISEQVLLSADPAIAKVLTQLKAIGFELCVDDFGRGHSSLSRLHQLSVNALKVDRSFVQALGTQQGREVAKTIVDFGHSANMTVIAEGIETGDQMRTLLAFGCQQAQGFWLADVLPPVAIDRLATAK
ncbi:MAG: EAL domain-containing protein [Cyanobacteria bacterium J06629_19]